MGAVRSKITKLDTIYTRQVKESISYNRMVIYTKGSCPNWIKAKALLDKGEVVYEEYDLEKMENSKEMHEALITVSEQDTLPNIFIHFLHIGDYSDLKRLHKNEELRDILNGGDIYNIF